MTSANARVVIYPVAVLGCALLASCETTFGVSRTVDLSTPPPFTCIEDAIARVPGIDTVKKTSYIGAYHVPTTRFAYRGSTDAVVAAVVVIEEAADGIRFSHSALTSVAPAQSYIDATRPVMVRVEQRLLEACGMSEMRKIEEHCKGTACPAIAY